MKKILVSFVLASILMPVAPMVVKAEETSTDTPTLETPITSEVAKKLSGYIVLQVEKRGEAYYINEDGTRIYLKDGQTAYDLMRQLGLGITDADLAKLQSGDKTLKERLKGKIVLQVQKHGEAYYINPKDGSISYLKNGDAAYTVMREKGLGITNKDLSTIDEQEIEEYKQWKTEREEFKKYLAAKKAGKLEVKEARKELKEQYKEEKKENKEEKKESKEETKKSEKITEPTKGLASLVVEGLTPAFDPSIKTYTLTLPEDAYTVNINATLVNPSDRLYINSNPATSGETEDQSTWNNKIKIAAISSDWSSEKQYLIKIDRVKKPAEVTGGLKSLAIEGLTPAFDPEVKEYTLALPDDGYTVMTTATLANTKDLLYINNNPAISGEAKEQGTWKDQIKITTISPNWKSEKTYTIKINRTSKPQEVSGGLKDLVIAGMTPAFDPEVKEYSVAITAQTYSIDVKATLANETDRLYINSNPATSGETKGQSTWHNKLEITVISPNWKNEKKYIVKLIKPDSSSYTDESENEY